MKIIHVMRSISKRPTKLQQNPETLNHRLHAQNRQFSKFWWSKWKGIVLYLGGGDPLATKNSHQMYFHMLRGNVGATKMAMMPWEKL